MIGRQLTPAVLLIFWATSVAGAPITRIVISGTAGSAIGNTTIVYTPGDWVIYAQAWHANYIQPPPALPDGLYVLAQNNAGQDPLRVLFGTGDTFDGSNEWNPPLTVGFYERVVRSFQLAHPSMEFGVSREDIPFPYSPNKITGRFVVLAADFDNPKVNSFAAKFEFADDSHPLGLISGEIFYNFEPTNSITLSNTAVLAPGTVTADITLAQPAPVGGAVVELSTNDPDIVVVVPTVTIPAGQQHATVSIEVQPTYESHPVDILSVYKGSGDVVTLNVTSAVPRRTSADVDGDATSSLPGVFHSQPDLIWTQADPTFVGLEYLDPVWVWDFQFGAATGQTLKPGTYTFVRPVGLSETNPPSFSITQRPRNSNVGAGGPAPAGSFQVFEVTVDTTYDPPKLISFSGKFDVQFGPGRIRGSVVYNEPPAPKHRAARP